MFQSSDSLKHLSIIHNPCLSFQSINSLAAFNTKKILSATNSSSVLTTIKPSYVPLIHSFAHAPASLISLSISFTKHLLQFLPGITRQINNLKSLELMGRGLIDVEIQDWDDWEGVEMLEIRLRLIKGIDSWQQMKELARTLRGFQKRRLKLVKLYLPLELKSAFTSLEATKGWCDENDVTLFVEFNGKQSGLKWGWDEIVEALEASRPTTISTFPAPSPPLYGVSQDKSSSGFSNFNLFELGGDVMKQNQNQQQQHQQQPAGQHHQRRGFSDTFLHTQPKVATPAIEMLSPFSFGSLSSSPKSARTSFNYSNLNVSSQSNLTSKTYLFPRLHTRTTSPKLNTSTSTNTLHHMYSHIDRNNSQRTPSTSSLSVNPSSASSSSSSISNTTRPSISPHHKKSGSPTSSQGSGSVSGNGSGSRSSGRTLRVRANGSNNGSGSDKGSGGSGRTIKRDPGVVGEATTVLARATMV